MVIEIDDSLLASMQLSERDVRVELFAHLFDQGRLSFGVAARLARVTAAELEEELRRRGIPRYSATEDSVRRDMEAVQLLESKSATGAER